MSQPTLSMTEAVNHFEFAGSGKRLFGSSTAPEITTSFILEFDEQVEVAVNELLAQAEVGGWEVEAISPDQFPQGSFSGTKFVDGVQITLTILVAVRRVSVSLQ